MTDLREQIASFVGMSSGLADMSKNNSLVGAEDVNPRSTYSTEASNFVSICVKTL